MRVASTESGKENLYKIAHNANRLWSTE